MNWVAQVWSVAAGACVALAGLHLLVWLRSRESAASLLFSIAAFAAGAIALQEAALMRAETAAEYGEVLRWMHVSAAIIVIAMVWFIRLHLHAGRIWLAWVVSGVRALVLLVNFLTSPNATFREITDLRFVSWLGETFSVPVGEPSPWRILIHLNGMLLLIYVLDAGVTAWRGGDHRRAVTLCGAIAGAIVLGAIFSQLMVWQVTPGPFIGLIFLLIVLAMAAELSIDLIRARQTAADLRKSEARMSLAARAANLGLWEWDIVPDRVWGNEIGLAQTRVAGVESPSFERLLEAVHAHDRGLVREAIRRLLDDGESVDIEYRTVDSGGGVRWVSARGDVDRGPDGQPRHVRGVTVDVTSQKRKDTELQQQRDQLTHVQRVSALGQLSSALAHEISQPLGAILRNAEAGELFLEKTPLDIEELRAILSDIQRDDQRAAAIIERTRSFLKPRESVLEALEVKELLEQVATFLKAEFQAHDTKLVLDLPRVLPAVRGDRIQLQQVVLNLLLNSLEALHESPLERRVVVIRVSSTAEQVEVAVIDRGPGIAADQMGSAFEPFMSTKKRGTGIGLSICKTIVESHGGRIWAEHNPGGGAILRCTLPAAQGGDPT
jgi:two-component system, LuxR family, sensor kinase FixL